MSTEKSRGPSAFQQVIDRLKEALALPTNKAVAEALGLTASNLGERKNRGALPAEQIEQLCKRQGLRLEWVMEGIPPVYEGGPLVVEDRVAAYQRPLAPPLDVALMTACIEAAEVALESAGVKLPADKRSRLVSAIYEFSLDGGRVNRAAIPALIRLAAS